RHLLAGHLEMDPTGMRALSSMNGEEAAHLRQDRVERAGLETVRRLDRVAMHRIARPDDDTAFALHRADQPRQLGLDVLGTHPADQRETTWFVAGIEDVDEPDQFVRIQARSTFDAKRVHHSAQEL